DESNNTIKILNFLEKECENHFSSSNPLIKYEDQFSSSSDLLIKYEEDWNSQFTKLSTIGFNDPLKLKIYNYFVEFKSKIPLTAYDDPMFSFVVDFYDSRAYYYDKQIEIFGDDLILLSSIESNHRFKVDDIFLNFVDKCLKETFVNIPENLEVNLKKSYFIASNLVNMIKILYKDEKLRKAHVGSKICDEGTWSSKTIDKIIEILVDISEEFPKNISYSVGEKSDKNTKSEVYNEYDRHVINLYKKNKQDRRSNCKKPDGKIFWIDDK
ncbi:hypothetical protein RhiirC2_783373, partial [Rhizophagus irregularis]